MEGGDGGEDVGAPPESWQVADVEESMKRLMLPPSAGEVGSATDTVSSNGDNIGGVVFEDALNQVDHFIGEALQNPRERFSVWTGGDGNQTTTSPPTQSGITGALFILGYPIGGYSVKIAHISNESEKVRSLGASAEGA